MEVVPSPRVTLRPSLTLNGTLRARPWPGKWGQEGILEAWGEGERCEQEGFGADEP